MLSERSAREEQIVAALYKEPEVVDTYLQKRFSHSWGSLLHKTQVAEVNNVLRTYQPQHVLELAPGPARIATELQGVRQGLMIDQSEAMLVLAKQRLMTARLAHVWQVQTGNAFEIERLQRQFDFLYTFRFIRHFQRDERMRLYDGMARCLHSHGLLMFDVVNQTVRQVLDARLPHKPNGELDVYDETYTPETFRSEVESGGFRVLRLAPVIKHFSFQSWISYRLDHRLGRAANLLVRLLEKVPSSAPLEWVALCQKTQ